MKKTITAIIMILVMNTAHAEITHADLESAGYLVGALMQCGEEEHASKVLGGTVYYAVESGWNREEAISFVMKVANKSSKALTTAQCEEFSNELRK